MVCWLGWTEAPSQKGAVFKIICALGARYAHALTVRIHDLVSWTRA